MEKRTLFALILSFLVIFIWQNLFMKKVPVKVGSAEEVTEEKEPQKEEVMEEKAPEAVKAEEHVFENQAQRTDPAAREPPHDLPGGKGFRTADHQ